MYGYCWWVAGPSDELSHIGIADSIYSAIGLGGNFLSVLPDIDTVVTVLTDAAVPPGDSSISWTAPPPNDDYQELIAHLVATLS
jgi:hypothetical protein